jgi:hypothetical protein
LPFLKKGDLERGVKCLAILAATIRQKAFVIAGGPGQVIRFVPARGLLHERPLVVRF